jgi:DNA-damage-inducible protein D
MSNIKLFESRQIRTEWIETEQKWYFAVIDVIEILTESNNPRRYWSDLKRKLKAEGFSQLYEIIVQLKMISSDGKKYLTDCSDAKGLLRIVQSIPSPKAEPFKQWLAQVGSDRLDEIENPELAAQRTRALYKIPKDLFKIKLWLNKVEKSPVMQEKR